MTKLKRRITNSNDLIDTLLGGDAVVVTMTARGPIYSLSRRLVLIDPEVVSAMIEKGSLVAADGGLIGSLAQSYRLGGVWAPAAIEARAEARQIRRRA